MNRKQVIYFLAIAQAGSLSKASARLRVAQPALSARLSELEASLGVRLFDRHARGVTLTAHGRTFFPLAQNIEAAFETASAALRVDDPDDEQIISLGVTPAIAVTILPALLDVISVDERKIEWNAQQAAALPLIELLLDGKIEAALIYHNPNHKGLRCVPLFSEDMVLVGLPSVLGDSRNDIPFQKLSMYDLVLDQKSHLLRQVIEQVAKKKNVRLKVQAEVNPLPAKRRLIEKGCCTIIPQNAFAHEIEIGSYVARGIVAPRLPVTLFLLLRANASEARTKVILSAVLAGLKKVGVPSHLVGP
jgi:LysR family nitrogen assimilation transcriptional regulator